MGFFATLCIGTVSTMGLRPNITDMLNESADGDSILPAQKRENELVTEAYVTVRRGNVRIFYTEVGGDTIEYTFSKDEPGLLTYVRKNTDGERLFHVFEKNVRHTCVHTLGGENFELISIAARLDNRLMTDGVLKLDYNIEAHGVKVETTEIRMTLTRNA